MNSARLTLVAALVCLGFGSVALADPLANEQLKFFQAPLNGGAPGVYPVSAAPLPTDVPAPFLGHDELSTAVTTDGSNYTGTMMADDFLDTNPNPIGHITWWGSYMNNTDPGTANTAVQNFRISLYTDVPASGSAENMIPSHPGTLIVSQTVTLGALFPSSGTFAVTPVPPNGPGVMQPGDSGLYQYNAELNWNAKTFPDAYFSSETTTDQIEWLSIVALVPGGQTSSPILQWGWHDRDYGIADPLAAAGFETATAPYHGGDDAVSGTFSFASGGGGVNSGSYVAQSYLSAYDGISSSKDLAFALYTVPEPTAFILIGMAVPFVVARWGRRTA